MAPTRNLTIDNNGVDLALSVTGVGPDVLFVHGLGSAQVLWQPTIEVLSARYTCWNLDVRGHGASDRAPGTYRLVEYATDVSAALDHIGRPTFGVGHSLGGMALSHLAAAAHDNLAAIYVLDSPLFRPANEPSTSQSLFERQLAMVRAFQAEGKPVDAYEAVLAGAPSTVGGTNGETMVPAQLRGRAESLSQMDPECMAVVVQGQLGDPVPPTASIPMRVIAADPTRSAAFKAGYGDLLTAITPHAEIRTIEGVGHQLMMMKGFDVQVQDDLALWLDRVVS